MLYHYAVLPLSYNLFTPTLSSTLGLEKKMTSAEKKIKKRRRADETEGRDNGFQMTW